MSDFIEIVKNLEDLPLKWLHRVRNSLHLSENEIDME